MHLPASCRVQEGEVVSIYVGNLAATVDEDALYAAFAQFGYVTNVQVRACMQRADEGRDEREQVRVCMHACA